MPLMFMENESDMKLNEFRRKFAVVPYDNRVPFNAVDFFKHHDDFSIYDRNAKYETAPFLHDFGKGYGKRLYINAVYVIRKKNGIDPNDHIATYIASEHFLDDAEQKKLAPYCRCIFCKQVWYTRIFASLSSSSYETCVKNGKQVQSVVKETIDYHNAMQQEEINKK